MIDYTVYTSELYNMSICCTLQWTDKDYRMSREFIKKKRKGVGDWYRGGGIRGKSNYRFNTQ